MIGVDSKFFGIRWKKSASTLDSVDEAVMIRNER